MKRLASLLLVAFCCAAGAQDYELEALWILGGPEASFTAGSDTVRSGTTVPGVTMDDVWAITNRADVLAAAAANQPELTGARAALTILAPVLADHPATVPSGGMFYELTDEADNLTLWFKRTDDGVASQLSAHDSDGRAIIRTRRDDGSVETLYPAHPGVTPDERLALATEAGLTDGNIAALQAYRDANVGTLFGTLTAAQRQFLNVQHKIVVYLLKREMTEVR